MSFDIDIENANQLFRLGSALYYQHDSGAIFTCDAGDLNDKDATEEVRELPDGRVIYEPEPNSIEGAAIDAWTDWIDERIVSRGPAGKMSDPMKDTARTLAATYW